MHDNEYLLHAMIAARVTAARMRGARMAVLSTLSGEGRPRTGGAIPRLCRIVMVAILAGRAGGAPEPKPARAADLIEPRSLRVRLPLDAIDAQSIH